MEFTRQWGKSTATAAKAVYSAYCQPDSLILALSPSARQGGEFVGRLGSIVGALGEADRGRASHLDLITERMLVAGSIMV